MGMQITDEKFDELVDEALGAMPTELVEMIVNCAVQIVDEAPVEEPDLLGLYEGIPLPERDSSYIAAVPDVVMLFRHNLVEMCESIDELAEEIFVTLVHELAHHVGIDDARLEELGWG